ncbi:MAG: H(+)/Cl(-) exchange transporter ClcA [Legionellaceae bacterium]|nr:H(+)/Cl(-) exchange transporter ClcA [Legionellaceae bacterium]
MFTRYKKILIFYALAILVGMLTGCIGAAFQLCIERLGDGLAQSYAYASAWGISELIISALISLIFVLLTWFLVRRVAPEASGSGVQEIEGALMHKRSIRWMRVLPVKFLGGVLSIVSGMVLGREGPTIQMGGNLGEAIGTGAKLSRKRRDALIASGAGAGLATAFNAPLAGVLFVMEEMREAYPLSFLHFKTVALSCVASTFVLQSIMGTKPSIVMEVFEAPGLSSLWIFFIFGLLVGFIGIIFNRTLMAVLNGMDRQTFRTRVVYVAGVAVTVGLLTSMWPNAVGGGYHIIAQSLTLTPGIKMLLALLVVRFVMTMLCYGTGVPGGIFAPMLALGTLLGLTVAIAFEYFLPGVAIHPGMLAVAGMGALFSAAVRAPITGIVLVVEMTQNYALILPLMIACLTATTVVQLAGVPPIYTQLLRRTLTNNKQQT